MYFSPVQYGTSIEPEPCWAVAGSLRSGSAWVESVETVARSFQSFLRGPSRRYTLKPLSPGFSRSFRTPSGLLYLSSGGWSESSEICRLLSKLCTMT